MNPALNEFQIMRKDNKWNSMSPDQEKIIAIAYVVKNLKHDHLKLSNTFKTSPPGKSKGKGKGKEKVKGKGKKQTGKHSQHGKGK